MGELKVEKLKVGELKMRKLKFTPRLSIDITSKQSMRLRELLPWGYMSRVYSILIDDLIDILEIGKEDALAALLARKLKLGAYLKDADGNLLVDRLDLSPGQYSKLTGTEKEEE